MRRSFSSICDVDLLGFGQHRDRRRGGVDAAAGLGGGHALHAVHAALELQPAVDAAALDERDHFLEAAQAGVARGHHLDLPALALGVARVHPEQLGRRTAPPRRRRCRRGSRAGRSSRRSDPWAAAASSSSPASSSRRVSSERSSSVASSRISASPPLTSSSVCVDFADDGLVRAETPRPEARSRRSAFACVRYWFGSDCTAGSASSVESSL